MSPVVMHLVHLDFKLMSYISGELGKVGVDAPGQRLILLTWAYGLLRKEEIPNRLLISANTVYVSLSSYILCNRI